MDIGLGFVVFRLSLGLYSLRRLRTRMRRSDWLRRTIDVLQPPDDCSHCLIPRERQPRRRLNPLFTNFYNLGFESRTKFQTMIGYYFVKNGFFSIELDTVKLIIMILKIIDYKFQLALNLNIF